MGVDINELAAASQNLLELHTQFCAHSLEAPVDFDAFDNLSEENILRLVADNSDFMLAGELLNDAQLAKLITQLDIKTLVDYAYNTATFSTILTLIDQDKMMKFIKAFDAEDFIVRLSQCNFSIFAEYSPPEKVNFLADKVLATLKILLGNANTDKYEVLLHSIAHFISESARQDCQKLLETNDVPKSTIKFVEDFKNQFIAQREHVLSKLPKQKPEEFKGYTDKMRNIRKKQILLTGLIDDSNKFLSTPTNKKFRDLVINFSKRAEEAGKFEHYGIFNKVTNHPSGTRQLLARFITEARKLKKTPALKHESPARRKSG